MSALLPTLQLDNDRCLARMFTPYQISWIEGDDVLHQQGKRAFAFAEKSIRIGWTFCDAFKNVRKRIQNKKRDYLFVTKDWPSALEYMNTVYYFADLFNLTGSIVSRSEDGQRVHCLGPDGRSTGFTEEIKIGRILFDNGSRIIAFSSHPQAMAVYGGDVGIDEFAKHPNAKLLWETAQGRVTLGGDIAIWSSHDGEDTLFNQFAQEARAGKGPWNLYFLVTMADALDAGLLEIINRDQDTHFTAKQFLADCRARAGSEEIFQQAYMCNPLGASTSAIVEWSAIERCRADYPIERVHLESADVPQLFGQFSPGNASSRQNQIAGFLAAKFPSIFTLNSKPSTLNFRLGFDVAASGLGDLAAFYIDEARGPELWLRALLTARTEDWHFLKTVLFTLLRQLPNLRAAGDESGLGRQICWEAASQFGWRFAKVNLAAKKHDLGFALMNQLAVAEKRFPRREQDIAADFFALRKSHNGTKVVFTEGPNNFNPNSHCDIAWAAALASHANTQPKFSAGGLVG